MRNRPTGAPAPIDRRRPLLLVLLVAVLALAAVACGGDDTASGSSGGAGATAPEYKVTVAGDSISVGLGAALRGAVGTDTVVKVIGIEGTGLARPDTFDWPARLTELARDFPPQVLVLSLGSNDASDLVDADGALVAAFSNTAAWEQEYAARLAASFDAFRDTGTHVIWVGHVRTQEERVGTVNRRVHEIATEVAADRDWVQVEDLADYLGSGEGIATTCLIEDGLHLSPACLDRAAQELAADLPPR
jgi:hypothetical protein